MRLFRAALCSSTLAFVVSGGPRVLADDEEAPREPLVVRVFDVGALTVGRRDFIPEQPPGSVHDEATPLFGGEAEEPVLPVGTIDELIELVKSGVAVHDWTEEEGTDLRAASRTRLVIRARPQVVEAVARFLADLERRTLATVTVELRAALVGKDADGADVEALLQPSAAGPSLAITAFPGQRAAAFAGRQRAVLSAYDAQVAQSSTASDPAVDVANLGLAAGVRAYPAAGGDAVRVVLDGFLAAAAGDLKRLDAGAQRTVEAAPWWIDSLRADVVLRPGTWRVVGTGARGPGGTAWAFLARATPSPFRGGAGPAPTPAFDAVPKDRSGAFESRRFDVQALASPAGHRMGPSIHLLPTSFLEPEPPELPEPMPPVPSDLLVEFLKETLPRATFEEDGATMEVRSGVVIARLRPGLLDAVEARLADLRRAFLWEVTTTAELVDVPDAVALRLLRPDALRNGAPLLDDEGRAALGKAARIDGASVACLGGTRNASESGRWQPYVADYEVRIAESAVAAKPVIGRCFSGFVLDVEPSISSGGDAVHLDVRAIRTEVISPIRKVETPHGPLELPEMNVLRVRTSLAVPFGKTAIVGAGGEGGRTRLLLVTPTLRRPGD
jgi:hypothetical protein